MIKHFEVFNDLLQGHLPRLIQAMMNQLPFQGPEEALDAGVVSAIPLSRHADSHARRRECLLIGEGCLLTAAIRMVEQPGLWASSL